MLIHANCFDALTMLEDDSVDHAIWDPPYDEHTHSAGRRGCTGYREPTRPNAQRAQFNRTRNLGFAAWGDDERDACAEAVARVSKRWALVFCCHEDSHKWGNRDGTGALNRAGLDYVRTMIWVKLGATPQFTGDRPAQAHECIVVAHRPGGRKRWNGRGKHGLYRATPVELVLDHDGIREVSEDEMPMLWRDMNTVYEVPIVLNRGARGEQRHHTTQKPQRLIEQLIKDFTDPGDVVLDPTIGSGTTAVACEALGRKWIGMEEDDNYVEITRARLGQVPRPFKDKGGPQPSLFDE